MGMGMGLELDIGRWTLDMDLDLDLDQEAVKRTIRTINGRASGRAGVIQDGVGFVETSKSEARSLIQPTSASRCVPTAKHLGPKTTGEGCTPLSTTTLHLQTD